MIYDNDTVRNKLIEITDKGLMLKSIALNVGVNVNSLSRFKNGMDCLKESELEVLSEYLNEVVIPQWYTIIKEPKNKPRNVSLDLLNSLD